jgi:GTPase
MSLSQLIVKPTIILIGKTNVGKSTLFNRLSSKRISIAHATPGATRDCIIRESDFRGNPILVVDSGGLEFTSKNRLQNLITQRVLDFINQKANLVLFVVSAKDNISSVDHEIAKIVRRLGKPVVLVINKVDHETNQQNAFDCFQFGFFEPVMVSAAQNIGLDVLKERVLAELGLKAKTCLSNPTKLKLIVSQEKDWVYEKSTDNNINISVVGKPNSGKSTFVNALLHEDRVMVSDIPGTTVDAIDTELTYGGKKICLIDTAGIRRKSSIYEEVEKMAVARALCAIDRSHVVLLMINAKEGVSEQDQKIAGMIFEKKVACVIAVNKWDEKTRTDRNKEEFLEEISFHFPFLSYVPVVFLSAKYGKNIFAPIDKALTLAPRYQKYINTSKLNRALMKAQIHHPPPIFMGKRLKMYFTTQIDHSPPTFVISCSRPNEFHFSYKRYLINFLRTELGLFEIPIRLIFRKKSDSQPFNKKSLSL